MIPLQKTYWQSTGNGGFCFGICFGLAGNDYEEDYWLLWCNNVPVGFARTNTSEMKPKIDFIIDEKLYPAVLCEAR